MVGWMVGRTKNRGKIMAKLAKALTAIEVSRLKTGTHPVGTVRGLYLQVTDTGSRSWILRAMVGDKRRNIGLGAYPSIGLAEAHDKGQKLRDEIAAGIDPVERRKQERADNEATTARQKAEASKPTFSVYAADYIGSRRAGWRNAKHADQWLNTLTAYAYPVIGHKKLDEISVADIVEILSPIWLEKHETASRVRGRIERVLAAGAVLGYRPRGDNPAALRDNLDNLLPKAASKSKRVKHHAALSFEKMGEFMKKLRSANGQAARALEFLILCAARSNEVRSMTWAEVDLKEKTWVIPAARMKAQTEHRVPLSDTAVQLLKAQKRTESPYVFPNSKGTPLSDAGLSKPLHELAKGATVHGFRSAFKDWASECTPYPNTLSEMALAHTIRDAVERAYRRGDLFAKRRAMMTEWANYCEQIPKAAKVHVLKVS